MMKMKKFDKNIFLIILVFLTLSLVGCVRPKPKKYDPSRVKFHASYNPTFENQIYPSLILGFNHLMQDNDYVADSTSLLTVAVTSPAPNAVLKIVVDSTLLNYTTTTQIVMPKAGTRYTFRPNIKWKYNTLYSLKRHGSIDATIHCIINDEEVDVKNLHLNYRSSNECLLSVRDTAGKVHDFRWMFAAYVDEDSPYIDEILTGMLEQGIVSRIVGYQSGNSMVVSQVEAIWYYVLEHGISYSSISTTSSPTLRANVQHIRFFEEVYKLRQANCIDACVFFASVMRKIGLKPVIFVVPGHAYLGYYTDKNRKNLKLLETTISQWVNIPNLTKAYEQTMAANPDAKGVDRLPDDVWKKYSRYLTESERQRWINGTMTIDQLKHAVSHYLFLKATEYNNSDYKKNKKLFYDENQSQYQMLDIERLRSLVQPI